MSVLADVSLRNQILSGRLVVDPLVEDAIQPGSIDLHLGETLRTLPYGVVLDPRIDQSDLWYDAPLRTDGTWMLGAMKRYLGVTAEVVGLPDDLTGRLDGVSSVGRLFVPIHLTAGVVDAGWHGRLTLEIIALGGSAILVPGMRIGQLTVSRMTARAARSYAGKYAGDTVPTPSRLFLEYAG